MPEETSRCPHCAALQSDFAHLAWRCPDLEQHRFSGDANLKQLHPEELPVQMLCGPPPLLTVPEGDANTCIPLMGRPTVVCQPPPAFFGKQLSAEAHQLFVHSQVQLHGALVTLMVNRSCNTFGDTWIKILFNFANTLLLLTPTQSPINLSKSTLR